MALGRRSARSNAGSPARTRWRARWPTGAHLWGPTYCNLPFVAQFDLVSALESLVPAPDTGPALRVAARTVKPGGTLLVCDDFLLGDAEGKPARSASAQDACPKGESESIKRFAGASLMSQTISGRICG